ncbi:hypothetical protein [Methylosinus sp. RM1]|uniref:hypothetical protein n=1 Tax=Methylosinus sp. RM1 TaxID=2583817 RepID=UPI00140DE80F|nr:hypothetical protein [Methylosinus sp. RM1]
MSDYLEKVNGGASVTLIKRALFKARGKKGGPGGETTLGKFMCFKPDGTIEKIGDSHKATFFEFESVPVNCLDDLYSVLTRAVKRDGVRAMVQAAPKPEFYGVGPVVRRVLGEGAPFAEIARPYMFLDIDYDTPIEGVDMSDAATVGEFVRSRLPPRFQKARCISYLSAGHGRNGCVRCRLIFWLDRPLTQSQQKALASTCEVIVDKSIYTAVSLIYLHFNMPSFSCPDPFKGKRWRCLPGEDHVVTPPNDELKNRTAEKTRPKREAQAKKVSEKTGRRIVYGSFEEILLTIGDPRDDDDVKLGFFEPITDAIKAFAREAYARNETPDADDCEETVAAAISAAYAAPSRENGGRAKASYLADLRRHVDGIFAGYEELRTQALARKLARAVPLDEATRIIHAKANEITAEVVRAKLKLPKRDVTVVFGAVDIDDDTTAIVEADTLAEQEEVASPIEAKPAQRARLGGAHLIKVTVGAGKTHAFIQAAADAAILGARVAWVAPTHKLARETRARFAEKGIDAQIWYGVEQPSITVAYFNGF